MSLQTIYNALRKGGLSRWGALAVMGNFQAESGNESVRLEGDYAKDRSVSKAWAADVDAGLKSRSDVIYMGRGWGLAQWTYWSRLAGLYDLCKSKGKSIGDEATQVEWFFTELKGSYPSLYQYLCEAEEANLYTATQKVCVEFERPAENNVNYRYTAANDIALKVKDKEEPAPVKETYWPPRMVDKNMFGPDVLVLQAVLSARGYLDTDMADGIFKDATVTAAKKFQKDNGLVVDGVVGPKTWAKLLEV